LYPGARDGGIFYFLTLANDILADRLDRASYITRARHIALKFDGE
jgi:hypothetical protein